MPLDRDLTREINRATAEMSRRLDRKRKWGSLVHTSTYGIRRYTNGSTLQAHVDVVATHAVSAILNVGQDADSDWPLQIMGHDGQAHSVIMAPGDMVLYESAKAIHARMIPLNGTSYDVLLVHFRPSAGEDSSMCRTGASSRTTSSPLIRPCLVCKLHRTRNALARGGAASQCPRARSRPDCPAAAGSSTSGRR